MVRSQVNNMLCILYNRGGPIMKRIRRLGLASLWGPLVLLCTSVFAAGTYAQDHPQEDSVEDRPCSPWEIEPRCSEGEFLQINGISLYYEVHGQGEQLLLLHGGGSSAENFNLMLPELTKHFRVITPDSRSQGRSTDTEEPLSYRLMVEDMIGLLDSLGIDSAYVGGWSDGAAIAIHMAIYYPERVRALLLTPVDLSAEALTEVFWEQVEQWDMPEKLETWWRSRSSPAEGELSGIRVPTLIVAGKDEQFIKHDHFVWWHRVIPNSELVWIPETDHFLVVNKPDEVNQVFLSFLNKHR